MEREFERLLKQARSGTIGQQIGQVSVSPKNIGVPKNVVVVQKKTGKWFKVLKWIVIGGIIITVITIICVCVQRVKSTNQLPMPFLKLFSKKNQNKNESVVGDDNIGTEKKLSMILERKSDEKKSKKEKKDTPKIDNDINHLKMDPNFTLLSDLFNKKK